jgi:hypothetical protein
MKSKILIFSQLLMMVVSSVGCLISILFLPGQSTVRLLSVLGLGIATLLHILSTRCPHCGRFGAIKPNLWAKDAGVCVHCHELVEYK